MDTNAAAFEQFKVLVTQDSSLPENIKRAILDDCSSIPPVTTRLVIIFGKTNASTQET